MRLRLESDGTAHGTRVLTEDGELIQGVQAVAWECDLNDKRLAEVTIRIVRMPVSIAGELQT